MVSSRIILKEAQRRRSWAAKTADQWSRIDERKKCISEIKDRCKSGEYVILKRKHVDDEPFEDYNAGDLQITSPGGGPENAVGGDSHEYEVAGGGFIPQENSYTIDNIGTLVTGWTRTGEAVFESGGRVFTNDPPTGPKRNKRFQPLLNRTKTRNEKGELVDAIIIEPHVSDTAGTHSFTLPVRIKGALTTGGSLLEELQTDSSKLAWLAASASVGIGDNRQETTDYKRVIGYAMNVFEEKTQVYHAHTSKWIVIRNVADSVTLLPESEFESVGIFPGGSRLVARTLPAGNPLNSSVKFTHEISPDNHVHIATVKYDSVTDLFDVTRPDSCNSDLYAFYRSPSNGLTYNGGNYTTEGTTGLHGMVAHKRGLDLTDNRGYNLNQIGDFIQSVDNRISVRTWVRSDAIAAISTGDTPTATIITCAAITETPSPRWLSLITVAKDGKVPKLETKIEEYLRDIVPSIFPNDNVEDIGLERNGQYTDELELSKHYRLVPMKGDDYDFSSKFGQSVHSHYDTFTFSNTPGSWFVGTTPSHALDGAECALHYLEHTRP